MLSNRNLFILVNVYFAGGYFSDSLAFVSKNGCLGVQMEHTFLSTIVQGHMH